MESQRSGDQEVRREWLDAGEVLDAVAAALREIPLGDVQAVAMQCRLTNALGDCVAAFSVESGASARAAGAAIRIDCATGAVAAPEPDLDCVDNIPV
jgi:hypothetical protein